MRRWRTPVFIKRRSNGSRYKIKQSLLVIEQVWFALYILVDSSIVAGGPFQEYHFFNKESLIYQIIHGSNCDPRMETKIISVSNSIIFGKFCIIYFSLHNIDTRYNLIFLILNLKSNNSFSTSICLHSFQTLFSCVLHNFAFFSMSMLKIRS